LCPVSRSCRRHEDGSRPKPSRLSQRTKEQAHDYRYFPEPDLPPISYADEVVDRLRASLPELPRARHARFVDELGLPTTDAAVLTADSPLADYFEAVHGEEGDIEPRVAANW
jgi:aspartyl-tRNA(Asn)/glutamyl-tRNA(Gln) amidotransferase subunit B